jgi:hypothetical protein
MRMDMVCSSTVYEAVISRARGATLTVKGEEGSEESCASDQAVTEFRAAVMTGGEIYVILAFQVNRLNAE